jgi:septal ring factor EnvC (AmiA/AmiB activator)
MRILRPIVLAGVVAVVLASLVSGQQEKPGTLDDLLTEVRGLRAEIRDAASASMRAQLVTARLTQQEARVSTLAQQLASVRQQLSDNRLTLAPFSEQLKQAQETNSQILAPLRNTLEQLQKRDRELRAQEAELARAIASEESRWTDFNSRLDEIERSVTGR